MLYYFDILAFLSGTYLGQFLYLLLQLLKTGGLINVILTGRNTTDVGE